MSILKIKDENGNWVGIPSIKGDKGDSGDTVAHAHRHARGGVDELTPEAIGAADLVHFHSPEEIGAATAEHTHTPESIGASPKGHTHTASEVGASPEGHNHDERYYTEAEVNQLLEGKAETDEVNASLSAKAPFPTWGTEDIEAGSASSSPTGTIHYVIE